MTRVKIFQSYDSNSNKLETEINQWLAANEDVTILNVLSYSNEDAAHGVTLFYEEPEPSRYDDENYDPAWGVNL